MHAGWPSGDLRLLATMLRTAYPRDSAMTETAAAMTEFAREAAAVDDFHNRRYDAAEALLASEEDEDHDERPTQDATVTESTQLEDGQT